MVEEEDPSTNLTKSKLLSTITCALSIGSEPCGLLTAAGLLTCQYMTENKARQVVFV